MAKFKKVEMFKLDDLSNLKNLIIDTRGCSGNTVIIADGKQLGRITKIIFEADIAKEKVVLKLWQTVKDHMNNRMEIKELPATFKSGRRAKS